MRYVADAYHLKEPPYKIINSIQLKTKELQSKMYLTETHRLIGFIKEAIGSLCGGNWTTFRVEKKSISAIKSPW